MKRLAPSFLVSVLVLAVSGCPDVDVDADEVGPAGPTVEFDPARSAATGARFIPFPNDLARDPMTGKVNLGPQACESATAQALREQVLNRLDGFGAYQVPMQVTFTAPVDEASLAESVVMYQIASDGVPLDPAAAMPVPIVTRAATTVRFSTGDCAAPEMVNAAVIIPTVPLEQRSTYVVALRRGLTTTDGEAFLPSSTWGLVAAREEPVTLDASGNIIADRTPLDPSRDADRAQLLALYQLWRAHQAPLAFLDATADGPATRADLLVAFAFTTQTLSDPLDPTIATSPAGQLDATGFAVDPTSITDRFQAASALCGAEATNAPTQCFLKLALGGCAPTTTGCGAENYQAGDALCDGVFACAAVSDVLGGAIASTTYQVLLPNSLAGGAPVPGPWSDPVAPLPQGALALQTVITVPAGEAPATGWPVVVFGHGLGSSKETLFAIAGRFAAAGFAAVAIDFSQHGSRAVRTSRAVQLGCIGHCFAGATDTGTECDSTADCAAGQSCGNLTQTPTFAPPTPTTAPQCYGAFLSADLASTRDNIRQSALDVERVVQAVRACGTASCGAFQVDAGRVFYAGQSLGAILGVIPSAMVPEIEAAVFDVGGVGWADILENTETLAIRCNLVNGLIDAGILVGETWTGGATGLCTTDAWKQQPGYAQFAAIGRWVLDPAEPANFAPRLRAKPHLIQEVVGDTVIPNVATERFAALSGAMVNARAADPFAPGDPFAESAGIAAEPRQSSLVRYTSDANHTYAHPSLLRPVSSATAAVFATLRLQVDLVQFLDNNDDDSL